MYELDYIPMEKLPYLRPMGFGEILDSSIRLYRENIRALIIAQLPLTLAYILSSLLVFFSTGIVGTSLFAAFTQSAVPTAAPRFSFGYLLLILLIYIIVGLALTPLVFSAVMKIASDSVLKTPSSVKEAYRFCIQHWFSLALTNFVLALIVGIIAAVLLFIPLAVVTAVFTYAFATGGSLSSIFAVLLVVLLFVALLMLIPAFLWTRWVITFPAAVSERIFVTEAMSRSWNMVKGHTIKTFLVIFLIFLIPFIIQYSPAIMEFSLGRSLALLTFVFGIVAQGVLIPLVHVTRVVVYFELRSRKEGFDLEKRIEQLQKQ